MSESKTPHRSTALQVWGGLLILSAFLSALIAWETIHAYGVTGAGLIVFPILLGLRLRDISSLSKGFDR